MQKKVLERKALRLAPRQPGNRTGGTDGRQAVNLAIEDLRNADSNQNRIPKQPREIHHGFNPEG
ncbi:MAG TPA: hypothetical protein VMW30_06850 [Candidatus Paceibacterota bacterium]|nr:hypothetical protein [Candidatus Paceibacterota bacterium]